jgi:thioredoxin 1
VKATSDSTFATDVLRSTKPVLVDFWAEWCGPCKSVAPILEAFATEHAAQVTAFKLDIDKNSATAMSYRIMSVPTILGFSNGQLVLSIVGAKPKAALLQALAGILS